MALPNYEPPSTPDARAVQPIHPNHFQTDTQYAQHGLIDSRNQAWYAPNQLQPGLSPPHDDFTRRRSSNTSLHQQYFQAYHPLFPQPQSNQTPLTPPHIQNAEIARRLSTQYGVMGGYPPTTPASQLSIVSSDPSTVYGPASPPDQAQFDYALTKIQQIFQSPPEQNRQAEFHPQLPSGMAHYHGLPMKSPTAAPVHRHSRPPSSINYDVVSGQQQLAHYNIAPQGHPTQGQFRSHDPYPQSSSQASENTTFRSPVQYWPTKVPDQAGMLIYGASTPPLQARPTNMSSYSTYSQSAHGPPLSGTPSASVPTIIERQSPTPTKKRKTTKPRITALRKPRQPRKKRQSTLDANILATLDVTRNYGNEPEEPENIDWSRYRQPIVRSYDSYKLSIKLYTLTCDTYDFAQAWLEDLFTHHVKSQYTHNHTTRGYIQNGTRRTFIVVHNAADPFSTYTNYDSSTSIGVYGAHWFDHDEIHWTTVMPGINKLLAQCVSEGWIREVKNWNVNDQAVDKRFHRAYWLASNRMKLGGLLNHYPSEDVSHDAVDEPDDGFEVSEDDLRNEWDVTEEESKQAWNELLEEVKGLGRHCRTGYIHIVTRVVEAN